MTDDLAAFTRRLFGTPDTTEPDTNPQPTDDEMTAFVRGLFNPRD